MNLENKTDAQLLTMLYETRHQRKKLTELEHQIHNVYNRRFGLDETPAKGYRPKDQKLSPSEIISLSEYLKLPRERSDIIDFVDNLLAKRK
jgi:hypothetical protein